MLLLCFVLFFLVFFFTTSTTLLSLPPAHTPTHRYSIMDRDSAISINPSTGRLYSRRALDRELEATHVFQVRAQEEPSGASLFINPASFKQ